MKKKIKAWLREWLNEETNEFAPKKSRDLRAVSFESRQPVGNGKYHEYLFQCTEWDNGEGVTIAIDWSYDGSSTEKILSLNHDEIDGILACLNDLEIFEV